MSSFCCTMASTAERNDLGSNRTPLSSSSSIKSCSEIKASCPPRVTKSRSTRSIAVLAIGRAASAASAVAAADRGGLGWAAGALLPPSASTRALAAAGSSAKSSVDGELFLAVSCAKSSVGGELFLAVFLAVFLALSASEDSIWVSGALAVSEAGAEVAAGSAVPLGGSTGLLFGGCALASGSCAAVGLASCIQTGGVAPKYFF